VVEVDIGKSIADLYQNGQGSKRFRPIIRIEREFRCGIYHHRCSSRFDLADGRNPVPSGHDMGCSILESFTLVRFQWATDEFFHALALRLCIRASLCPKAGNGFRNKKSNQKKPRSSISTN
jgi:hypothetical protein